MRTLPALANQIVQEVDAALYQLFDFGGERVERKMSGVNIKVVAYRVGRDFRVDVRPSEAYGDLAAQLQHKETEPVQAVELPKEWEPRPEPTPLRVLRETEELETGGEG
jgi:hypothetical protein